MSWYLKISSKTHIILEHFILRLSHIKTILCKNKRESKDLRKNSVKIVTPFMNHKSYEILSQNLLSYSNMEEKEVKPFLTSLLYRL